MAFLGHHILIETPQSTRIITKVEILGSVQFNGPNGRPVTHLPTI